MKDLMELVEECTFAKAPEKEARVDDAILRAKELREAGFITAAEMIAKKAAPIVKLAAIAGHKYIEITPEKIQAYLNRKAEAYNKERTELKESKMTSTAYNVAETASGLGMMLESAALQRFATSNNSWITGRNIYWATTPVSPQEEERSRGTIWYSAHTKDMMSYDKETTGHFAWAEDEVSDYDGVPPVSVVDRLAEVRKENLFDYFTVASVRSIPDPLLLGRIRDNESRFFLAQWGTDVSLDEII